MASELTVGKVTVSQSGNGEVSVSRDSGATILTQAQSALGKFGTTSNHSLQLMANNTGYVTIDSAGLATFSAGIVTSEKGIISGSVTVADDAVTTITPLRKGGFLTLASDSTHATLYYPQPVDSGQIWFDCGTSLDIKKLTTDATTHIGSNIDVSVSDVTGTTGTDGKVTVAVQTDVIKIENRSGSSRDFNYTVTS